MKKTILRFPAFPFLLLLLICSCSGEQGRPVYAIEPPFQNIEIEKNTLSIDPSVDQTVRFSKDLSVEIPANAFCDEKGNLIKGKVELSVEQYDTKAKILASGIPMKFHDGEKEGDFESAGMFQIEGMSGGKKINIVKGRELTVNHKSAIAGDFDFFYFEEKKTEVMTAGMAGGPVTTDKAKQGQWQKLSTAAATAYDTSKTLKNFNLKFMSTDYPELKALESIRWHLATSFQDPTSKTNDWVLNTNWSSLEISEPTRVLGDPVFDGNVNETEYLGSGAILVSPEENTVVTVKTPVATIWSRNNKTIYTINGVKSDFQPVKYVGNDYLLVETESGVCLYSTRGQLLGNFGETHGHEFSLKTKKVVYQPNGEGGESFTTVLLSDFSGKLIKKIILKNEMSGTFMESNIYSHFVLTPDDKLITNSLTGIDVYDLNGNLIVSKPGKFAEVSSLPNNNILCREISGQLLVWNYKTNQQTESKAGTIDVRNKLLNQSWHMCYEYEVNKKPYVVINQPSVKDNLSWIWNYNTNDATKLGFYIYTHNDTICPEIISGYDYETGSYHVYNLEQKKELVKIPKFGWNGEGYNYPKKSPKLNLMIIDAGTHAQLRKMDGTLLRDFKLYDSLISIAGFTKSDKIFTVSSDGVYKLWDTKGNELKSAVLKNCENVYAWEYDDRIYTYDMTFRSSRYFDINGQLELDPGRIDHSIMIDSSFYVRYRHNKKCQILPILKKEKYVSQLLVRNDKEEFQTYVFLDEQTKNLLDKYYTFRAKKIGEEKDRQKEEERTVRTFKMANFGIYNYDKLINQPNRIYFAADFQFDTPTEYSNITIFLVTELNGNAVVKFYRNAWQTFSLDPAVANKIIAVLPDNKIAVLSAEDLKKIDWAAVKKEGKYIFKMKTVDKKIESLTALETYL